MSVRAETDYKDLSRFMERYARGYGAGAFAMPLPADIEAAEERGMLYDDHGTVFVARTLDKGSTRKDFTGEAYKLEAGSTVITHLAAKPDGLLPMLDGVNYVFAYLEDENIVHQLEWQGFSLQAVRVSAASELIGCYSLGGRLSVDPVDLATVVRLPDPAMNDRWRGMMVREAQATDSWFDDFPYYSDGTWSAVSLRGFNPADPTWGVKPAEMGKSWHAKNPGALEKYPTCEWTVLAERTPGLRMLVESLGFAGLERVRLLKMASRDDGKTGTLSRHTDVTDKAAGTRDGQIVRFHYPLITHEDIRMSCWNLAGDRYDTHLPPGSLWYLDARKPHAVSNPSPVDRIHLVIDVVADAKVREFILSGTDVSAGAEEFDLGGEG